MRTDSPAWTQSDDNDLRDGIKQGLKWHEIAAQLGCSPEAARSRYRRLAKAEPKRKHKAAKPVAVAEKSQAGVVLECEWSSDDEEDISQVWRRIEEDSDRRIRKALKHSQFTAKFPGDRYIAISFVSDQHIAPGTPVDHRQMRLDAELIAATPGMYCILAGDGVDNHIKHFAAILAAKSQPDDQYTLFEHYLGIFEDKILVVISGNHDLWTKQHAGVDMVSRLSRGRSLCYSQDEAFVTCSVGSQTYVVAARHQYHYNSKANQTHSVKQWLKEASREFDVGCIGHHHEHAVESCVYRRREVWVCRPGAYQITSAHSGQYGFNTSIPTCPTFILSPHKREIIGVSSVHRAPDILKALNA